MSDSIDELRRVRLEPAKSPEGGSSSNEESWSDPESAPSDDDGREIEYEVDAIKWAHYRDSRFERVEGGYKGWHYGTMWKGYLKTGSETEQRYDDFVDGDGNAPMVAEFWAAVAENQPAKTVRPPKKEPRGALNELIETPRPLLRSWFRGISGRDKRDPDTYWRRRAKELEKQRREARGEDTSDLVITKADSDYYWNRKRRRDRKKNKGREAKANSRPGSKRPSQAPAGPSRGASTISVETTTPAPVAVSPAEDPTPEVETAPTSPASTLGSLFNSDKEEDRLEDLFGSDEEVEEIEVRPIAGPSKPKSTKRKLPSSSPIDTTTPLPRTTEKTVKKSRKGKEKEVDEVKGKGKEKMKDKRNEPEKGKSKERENSKEKGKEKEKGKGKKKEKEEGKKPEVEETPVARAMKLMTLGKIAKKSDSAASDLSFGQLQPGIFDAAPSPVSATAPAEPAAHPAPVTQPAPTSTTTAPSQSPPPVRPSPPASTASPTAPQHASATIARSSPFVQVSTPLTVSSPVETVASAGPSDAGLVKGVDPRHLVSSAPKPVQIATAQTPPTPVASPVPPPTTAPAPLAGPSAARPSAAQQAVPAAHPVPPRPGPPTHDVASNTQNAGPVPHFNPAPVKPTPTAPAKPRNPTFDSRPKYVQPTKIQIVDNVIDPVEAARLARIQYKDSHVIPQPSPGIPQSAYAPSRPKSSAFVPRAERGGTTPQQSSATTQPPTGPRVLSDPRMVALWDKRTAPNGNMSPTLHQIPGHLSPNATLLNGQAGSLSPRTDIASPVMQVSSDPRRRKVQPITTTPVEVSPPLALPTPVSANKQISHNLILKPVDTTGGLVTFSPFLLLQNPGKLAEIMKLVRDGTAWGGYLIPSLVEFVNNSWRNTDLCPDSTKSFSVLVQYLSLDDQMRSLSGAGIASGGGLSISCCPPSPYDPNACVAWKEWLHQVSTATEYTDLVELCKAYSDQIRPKAVHGDLSVQSIEDMQVDDLKGLKNRKDVVDYTRFVYVTEEKRIPSSSTDGIEYLTADEFLNLLQFN